MNTEIEKERRTEKEHKVELFGRGAAEVTGVSDVESYTEESVVAVSSMGAFSIEGEDIRIESFSSQSGRLSVRGKIDGFFYFGEGDGKKKRAKTRPR